MGLFSGRGCVRTRALHRLGPRHAHADVTQHTTSRCRRGHKPAAGCKHLIVHVNRLEWHSCQFSTWAIQLSRVAQLIRSCLNSDPELEPPRLLATNVFMPVNKANTV